MPEFDITVSFLRQDIVSRRCFRVLGSSPERAQDQAIQLAKNAANPKYKYTDYQIDSCKPVNKDPMKLIPMRERNKK